MNSDRKKVLENPHVDALLSGDAYQWVDSQRDHLLLEALRVETLFHYENNALYKKYCDRRQFNPIVNFRHLEDLPFIHVRAFKELGAELCTVNSDMILMELKSSATTGRPSVVPLDRLTARRQAKALVAVLVGRFGKSRLPMFVIDVDPKISTVQQMGSRGAAVRGFLNMASSTEYFMTADGSGNLTLQEESFVDRVLKIIGMEQPIVVFGFTYVLYSYVIRPLLEKGLQLPLPKGSYVIHIGGWKKLQDQKVSRNKMIADVASLFAIQDQDVVDIYGFTEQMGLNYPDFADGWKRMPAFAEIFIRDPETLQLLPPGKPGLIQIVTPIPHSYPGISVLTDDVGVIDAAPDPHNPFKGTRFRVIGRASKTEARGCGDIMAEKIVTVRKQQSEQAGEHTNIQIFSAYGPRGQVGNYQNVSVIEDLIKDMKEAQLWLRAQPVDCLIGLVRLATERWQLPNLSLDPYRKRGLSFLIQWASSTNLESIADKALLESRAHLDGFRPFGSDSDKMIRAIPRGLVMHWLSGNVPVLGMLVILQCIIAKNANIIRVASMYSHVVPELLKAFEGLIYYSPGGYLIRGDDLLKTIGVIYFEHDHFPAAELLSINADVRLGWGGREAVEAVAGLSHRFDAQDIIFGPKVSFMAIGREFLKSNKRALKKLIRRAATDVSVFDQTACSSPHTIFVEQGGDVSPKEFAVLLAEEMARTLIRIPKEPETEEVAAEILSRRIRYEFYGDLWTSKGTEWTVLYDEECKLAQPTSSRVVVVRSVPDIMMAATLVNPDIQTVGLALSGDRRLCFADHAAMSGAERFPEIGFMTNFDSPWDGVFVIQRVTRWVTLGGS